MGDLLDDDLEFRGGTLQLSSESVRGDSPGNRRDKPSGTANRSPQINPSVLSGADSLTSSTSSFAGNILVSI